MSTTNFYKNKTNSIYTLGNIQLPAGTCIRQITGDIITISTIGNDRVLYKGPITELATEEGVHYTSIDNLDESVGDFFVKALEEGGASITKDYVDSHFVGLANDQTIADIKTFSSSPIIPTPTANMQASTKKYVDDTVLTINTWINEQK